MHMRTANHAVHAIFVQFYLTGKKSNSQYKFEKIFNFFNIIKVSQQAANMATANIPVEYFSETQTNASFLPRYHL